MSGVKDERDGRWDRSARPPGSGNLSAACTAASGWRSKGQAPVNLARFTSLRTSPQACRQMEGTTVTTLVEQSAARCTESRNLVADTNVLVALSWRIRNGWTGIGGGSGAFPRRIRTGR